MPGIPKRLFGPLALTTTLTTNVYNPASGLVVVVRQLHIVNKTAGAVTLSLWLGATGANAAGTELFSALSIPANQTYDWWTYLVMTNSDFLVGGAGTTTALSITGMGDQLQG